MSRLFFRLLAAAIVLAGTVLVQSGCSTDSSDGNSSSDGELITVSGTVQYEDREYGPNGFTSKTYSKAIRFALVEVVESSTGTVLASGDADSTGAFSITFNSSDDASAYVRVVSATTGAAGPKVEVYNNPGSGDAALYAVGSNNFILQDDVPITVDLSIGTDNPADGAFNILDVFISGSQFVQSLSGTYPSTLKVYWEKDGDIGTWYCTGYIQSYCSHGEGIYVLGGGNGDTDEFDDDVLWHEFSHFVTQKFSRNDSQGGEHFLTDNDLDLRLAWAEGWGDFFPGAVKTLLNSTDPSLLSTSTWMMPLSNYVDTFGTGDQAPASISIDMADPGLIDGKDPFVYSSSEVSVAKVLWKLMEGFQMQQVWDVFDSYLPDTVNPVTLEAFWDGWLSMYTTDINTLDAIYTERSIFYKEDSYEEDDISSGSRKATLDAEEVHYLYRTDGTADKDIVAFDAFAGTAYTIETYCLKNGADTYLRLLDSDGSTELAVNDDDYNSYGCDPDNFTRFTSKITYTIPADGTYYVEVMTSPEILPLAGRYGTYTLRITR